MRAQLGLGRDLVVRSLAFQACFVSATTVAARMMGMEKSIGMVAPGFYADIAAVDGDPLKDVDVTINKVRWVMKDGAVVVDKTRR